MNDRPIFDPKAKKKQNRIFQPSFVHKLGTPRESLSQKVNVPFRKIGENSSTRAGLKGHLLLPKVRLSMKMNEIETMSITSYGF